MKNLAVIFSLLSSFAIWAQPNIGLVHNEFGVSEGYTLFSPELNTSVYLINNCGEKVNEWSFSEKPGATCYLLENGNLLRAGKDSLEIRDWDNTLIWSYAVSDNGLNQHHDIEPLPNGNILMVCTDGFSDSEIVQEGRDSLNVGSNFKLDKIVELEPVGTNDALIIWEWRFVDHLVQDIYSGFNNYGIVSNHPELMDINYSFSVSNPLPLTTLSSDYTHVNAVDYNAELDQILISCRHLSEIYIVDHSTTIAEAASHSGGNSNKGGDFLWRWGNPQAYGQGLEIDQKLFLQHDAKWVESGYLDAGKISVFNNRNNWANQYSSIHLIEPEIINDVYQESSSRFLPIDFDWSWDGTLLNAVMSQGKKSGVQSLQGGNLIVCETGRGMASEITKSGTLVWSYVNPHGVTILNQNESVISNSIFRAEKYPVDYLGFTGQDMTTTGIIEDQNSFSELCVLTIGIEDVLESQVVIVNPVEGNVIRFVNEVIFDEIIVVDLQGRIVYFEKEFQGTSFSLNVPPSIYVLSASVNGATQRIKIVIP